MAIFSKTSVKVQNTLPSGGYFWFKDNTYGLFDQIEGIFWITSRLQNFIKDNLAKEL